jgi:succinyl-diaminopimelate desuccinylase
LKKGVDPKMDEERLLSEVRESEVVKYCRDLVRIRTVNPPGDEIKAAEYVASTLKQAGLDAELVEHTPNRASMVARLKGSGRKPALLYNGHLDTVPVGSEKWDHEPFGGEIADGKIWGRGASDMKGGLAAMMAGMKAVARAKAPLQGDLIFAATAGEEVDSLGATSVAAIPGLGPLQAIVISEPSSNEMFVAEKGAFWLELTTHGRTAHGSMPEQGRNAILMMMKLLEELEKQTIPFQEHPLVGGFTRSVNTIAGGVKTNVVPDSCVATIDMRTVPGQDHRAIRKQVEDLIAELGRRIPDFKVTLKVTNDRPPLETSTAEPAVQKFMEVLSRIRGATPVPKGVAYFSDAVVFVPALGAPMILCGPGEARLAHQPNEYVEISSLVQSAKIFALAAARLLQ